MGGKRVTTESYMEDVEEIHKGKGYSYKKDWEYTGSRCTINIHCKDHGWWSTEAYSHRNMKSGCPKCAEEFRDARCNTSKIGKHVRDNNRKYKRQEDKDDRIIERILNHFGNSIEILSECVPENCFLYLRCIKHDWKYFKATSRLSGNNGCKYCSQESIEINNDKNRHNKEDVISKFKDVHGNRYDYSKVDYINITEKVEITCPAHGSFWVSPANHIRNMSGCRECWAEKASKDRERPLTEWLGMFSVFHGDRYDYSLIGSIRSTRKMPVVCRLHGEFKILPRRHYLGWGCPSCSSKMSGFRVNMPAILYYIKITCPETFEVYYKIGITNKSSVEDRFPKSNLKYYSVIRVWKYSEGYTAINREVAMIRKYKDLITKDRVGFWRGGGVTEMFDKDVLNYDKLS